MPRLVAAAALVVSAACIAMGEWIYLVYAGAVWFASTRWTPSWRSIPLRQPSTDPARVEQAKRWRSALLPACAASWLLMAYTLRRLIVAGDSVLAVVLASLLTFGLFAWVLILQRRVEAGSDL